MRHPLSPHRPRKKNYKENPWVDYRLLLRPEREDLYQYSVQDFKISDLIPKGHSVYVLNLYNTITHGLKGTFFLDQEPREVENNKIWKAKKIFYEDQKDSLWIPFEDFNANEPFIKEVFSSFMDNGIFIRDEEHLRNAMLYFLNVSVFFGKKQIKSWCYNDYVVCNVTNSIRIR